MSEKRKILLVGGMDYNIPKELKEAFDIVKHITQASKFQSLPQVDYVFVITEWAGHNLVESVKKETNATIIPLPRGGWEAMKQDLERRSILMPVETPVSAEAAPEKPPPESLFSSMSESDVWKKYGTEMIKAVQGTLKPKEVVSEDDTLEALSLSGVPKADCAAFLPKLQLKGILDPCGDGKWRLMAAPGTDFDNERADPEAQAEAQAVAVKKGRGNGSATGVVKHRQVRMPSLLAMISGLPKGPYASKRAISEEMRKYVEFDALSDWQVGKYVDRAIGDKLIDDSNRDLFIKVNADVHLTRKQEIQQELKMPDEIVKEAEKAQGSLGFMKPKTIDKTEAEASWCHVVEKIRKERERLGNVLSHCRIEWMGDNHVLVIFVPAVLAQWMKFVESTENWGLVSQAVQERFYPNTVIRFMLDNGLRI